jgi:signal peptidase
MPHPFVSDGIYILIHAAVEWAAGGRGRVVRGLSGCSRFTITYIYNNRQSPVNTSGNMAEEPRLPDRPDGGALENGFQAGPSGPEGVARRTETARTDRPVRKLRKTASDRLGGATGRTEGSAGEGLEDREDLIDKENIEELEAQGNEDLETRSHEKDDEESDMDPEGKKEKESPRKAAAGILKDVVISAAIVGGILLVLYLFSGVWPPMVVIESSSMMHGDDSQIGVIDTGDLTLVQKVSERGDIVTYVEATCRTNPHYGLREYGDYGNVIVYRKNGRAETPVIHRAIAWVEYNASVSDPSRRIFRGDLPDIGIYNVSEFSLYVTSYRPENYLKQEKLTIQISAIFAATTTSVIPHSGFVTKGDHNIPYVDQWVLYVEGGVRVEPVKLAWVVGKAQGELPWFGIFKLWISGHDSRTFPKSSVQDLVITVIILVVVPIVIDYLQARMKKKRQSRKDDPKRADLR